jgi:hypothetical protein
MKKIQALFVGTSFIALTALTSITASAYSSCIPKGNQVVFDSKGNPAGEVLGSEKVGIELKNIDKDGCGKIAEFRINLPNNEYRTVYKISNQNLYIDISSCASIEMVC